MEPVESYLRDLSAIHSSGAGVAETSYYPPLSALLNEIGRHLKPKVLCVINLAERESSGIPDGGLFTPEDFPKRTPIERVPRNQLPIPSRGAIEVKSTRVEVEAIIQSEQVAKYLRAYGQVLVTNLRAFVLVERGDDGPIELERFAFANSECAFWDAAARSRNLAQAQGEGFIEFAKRVMLRPVPLEAPRDVAWFLGSYAKNARIRVEGAHSGSAPDLPALATIRTALQDALGITFEPDRGERFFRSTLVQTLFYGVFAAWVLWRKQRKIDERFDWRLSAYYLKIPILQKLFHDFSMPGQLEDLGISDALDRAADVLNRVQDSFFLKFRESHAVQYFYEPFLEAFDPEMRRELGVWYTPPEVVDYMVRRVDNALRDELGIKAGLADSRVVILDPCCGTGAFLVGVLQRIAARLRDDGEDALVANDLKKAATSRVFGFEILPAPYVIAHLQIGLVLQESGAALSPRGRERAGIYLTNALTGWEPAKDPKALLFTELQEERSAADHVKQEERILVVIGNPPYNGFAGMAVDEERDLSTAYRTTKRVAAPQGQGLNDLYVRFYRMAERRIIEKSGQGLVCFISNYSWLDGLSFTGMRERYLDCFDQVWIDCLNGDKYKTGKLTPEGEPDPSVFSTETNREGIQVGAAIALLVRREDHAPTGNIRFRHLWGKAKREQLTATPDRGEDLYQTVTPRLDAGLPFLPSAMSPSYMKWPLIADLLPVSFPGVKTSRDGFLVDIDRDRLDARIAFYFDEANPDQDVARRYPAIMTPGGRFPAREVRASLVARGRKGRIVRYAYRPFDIRWLYWDPDTKLLDEKRPEYMRQVFEGNVWLSAGQRNRKEAFYQPQYCTVLADHHLVESNVGMFPMLVLPESKGMFAEHQRPAEPNMSPLATAIIRELGGNAEPEDLFMHIVAALHAPIYAAENVGALRQDWPRVPLPTNVSQLQRSAELGRTVAVLLDMEQEVIDGVTTDVRAELRVVARVRREDGAAVDPTAGDLRVDAGWGHFGADGAAMPGKGVTRTRNYTAEELGAIDVGLSLLGMTREEVLACWGETMIDVYLNDQICWSGVPARVWAYVIGGYQALKKWLSYRETALLGRELRDTEVREFRSIARRISALLLLGPALDANYRTIAESASSMLS